MYSNRWINKVPRKSKTKTGKTKNKNWREYQINKTGKDPLLCPCCSKEMILVGEYYDNRTRWVRTEKKDEMPDYWPIAV